MKMKFLLASLLMGASVSVFAQGFKDGIDFYSIGDYENAKTILNRNINSAANKSEAYYYYGMIDFKEGNLDSAKANFDKGVAADANNPYNYVGQGAVMLKQGNKAGEDLLKTARKLAKKDAKVEVAIAVAYFAADPTAYDKKIEKCLLDARKWSKDEVADTYIFEGDMSMARGDVGDAMGKYEMAFTKDDANIEATVKYADTYFQVNKELRNLRSQNSTKSFSLIQILLWFSASWLKNFTRTVILQRLHSAMVNISLVATTTSTKMKLDMHSSFILPTNLTNAIKWLPL